MRNKNEHNLRIILIFLVTFISSCISDTENIQELLEPKMAYYDQFDFSIPNGKITYQFYHEYGFTDIVWHLITIMKPEFDPKLKYKLPLDSIKLRKLSRIDLRKFVKNKPIIFTGDYKINSDVSLRAEQFYLENSNLIIGHEKGSYSVEIIGDVEMLRIYDAEKGIEYIELKR